MSSYQCAKCGAEDSGHNMIARLCAVPCYAEYERERHVRGECGSRSLVVQLFYPCSICRAEKETGA
jgi:DNA-directed RNA polymerase subunit RPC12/RpoP